MSFGTRLKELRESRGLKQQDLAKVLGLKNTAISNYELGISSPREDTMFKIFEFFDVTPNYMFQDEIKISCESQLSQREKNIIMKYKFLDEYGKQAVDGLVDIEYDRCTAKQVKPEPENMVTILHSFYKASAGTGVYLPDSDNDWEEIDIPDTPEARKADYALTIQGDSMEPVYFDGDVVLVKQCDTIDLGQIGIFVVDGEGYIKKFGGDRLISLNDKYNDIELGEYTECRCMGKVIGRISR